MQVETNQHSLDELKKRHLTNLKQILNKTPLNEYYQFIVNSIDSSERTKLEQKKLNRFKTSDKQLEYQRKQFKTNWNLDYCDYCKLDYWPSNCQVFMLPKCRLTFKNAKILTKYRLFNYKPKYKSYKDRLITKILNKGIRLVYKCKRCRSKNVILNETKRDCSFKPVKMNNKNLDKNLKVKAKTSKTIHTTSFISINLVGNHDKTKMNGLAGKKKFQSLQIKLKQNELEQNLNKSKQKSLADFLTQLT